MEFHIGHSEREFISFRIKERSYPKAQDFYDGNWLNVAVVIKAGSFSGALDGQLRANELISFRNELTKLYGSLSGSARFSTMEKWLSLEITGDGKGHFVLTGKAADEFGHGNVLNFRLYFDQTFVPEALNSLEKIIQVFPVLGRD